MPTDPTKICDQDFQFDVRVGPLQATLDIIEGETQSLSVGDEFNVKARYTIGRPSVVSAPFEITFTPRAGEPLPVIEILSVSPIAPNTVGVTADEVQYLLIEAVITAAGESDEADYYNTVDEVFFAVNVSMYQPDFGDVNATTDLTVNHTGPGDNIPNLRSTTHSTYVVVAWDIPRDDMGNEVEVDGRIVITDGGEGSSILEGAAFRAIVNHFQRVWENITVTNDLIVDILNMADPLQQYDSADDIYQKLNIKLQLKRDGQIFNRDDTDSTLQWTFPFGTDPSLFPTPHSMELALVANPDRPGFTRWKLDWKQSFWFGNPEDDIADFQNLWPNPQYTATFPPMLDTSQRLLKIDHYEWRQREEFLEPTFTEWTRQGEIIHTRVWGGQVYESVESIVRSYPAIGEAGRYVFQGRALDRAGSSGEIIELRVLVADGEVEVISENILLAIEDEPTDFTPSNEVQFPHGENMTFQRRNRGGFQTWTLQWEQPYWFGDPENDIDGDYINLWPSPEFVPGTVPPQLNLNDPDRRLIINYYEYRFRKATELVTSDWERIDSGDIVRSLMWTGEIYESVHVTIRAYPFGADDPDRGVYIFQGRAVDTDGNKGPIVELSEWAIQ